ncbi:MAG: MEDS domain-containing protein [Candidatus Sulfotelmatobacter sp.]
MADHLMPVMGEDLGLGDHVAYFFKNNEERLGFVIPYMVSGLRKMERCVYVADENTVPDILSEFKKAGIDIDAATSSGALSVLTKHDTYLRHGIFEPERMIADLDRDVRHPLQSGFTGLRITGDMSWALDLPYALSRLCDYEHELYHRWPAQLSGLCQYNETLFPNDVIERMASCHWIVVRDGNMVRHPAHRPADLI